MEPKLDRKQFIKDLAVAFGLWLIKLAAWLAGWIAVPLALLACDRNSERLPRLAWLWDNDDDGINGDWPWQSTHGGKTRTHLYRLRWLQVRNPVHNLAWRVLSVQPGGHGFVYSEGVEVSASKGIAGFRYMECTTTDGRRRFLYRWVTPWSQILPATLLNRFAFLRRWAESHCIRGLIGWRLWYLQKASPKHGASDFTCNPFSRFKYQKGAAPQAVATGGA